MKSVILVLVLAYLFQLGPVQRQENLLTPQIRDSLFYKGEMYPLSKPYHLEAFFNQYPERRPSNGNMSTALWRAYVATFEFKEKEWTVKDLHVQIEETHNSKIWLSVFGEVFPEGVDARFDSLSGNIFLAKDILSWSTYNSSKSSQQGYFLLKLNNGYLIEEEWFTRAEHERYKDHHFSAFKQTIEYQEIVKNWKRGIDREEMDSVIRDKLFIIQLLESL